MDQPPTPLEFEKYLLKNNIPPKAQNNIIIKSNNNKAFNVIFNNKKRI